MARLNVSPDVLKLNPGLEGELETIPASKYRNVQAEAYGLRFASGHEASVISGLILLEKQHRIFALRLQVRFPLPGKTTYIADAVYLDKKLLPHIVDAKGFETQVWKIKRRLFKATYNLDIETA